MTQRLIIHPDNPQRRLIRQAADVVRAGGVIIYPTDSAYALGCSLGAKDAVDRIRRIRQLDKDHHFTLMCRDLSELATYARVDNVSFRLLKANTPGAYTFLLTASSEVPRRLLQPKRKTIGLRVPANPITLALLEELDEPLMSVTLILPGATNPIIDTDEMYDTLGNQVDLMVDGGYCGNEPTTIVDLVDAYPVIIRSGKGDPTPFVSD